MKIDFRSDRNAPNQLRDLDATTMNSLVDHFKKRGLKISGIQEMLFGDGRADLVSKIGWATGIARYFNALVHFSHAGTPITAHPNAQSAAMADYERRKSAGEKVIELREEICAECRRNRAWHDRHRPNHSFVEEE